jgi:DNA-binding NarL/FixJ family response regulator
MTIRVLVADDHQTFARAVGLLLDGDPDIDVVGQAADGAAAVELTMSLQPDVVLMDINMPGVDGIEATARIVDAAPHVAVIVLTMFDDDDNVAAAMQRGATGYLLKGARQEQIRRAVHAAHAGEAILDASVARRLKDVFSSGGGRGDGVGGGAGGRARFPQLTERELDVLDRLAAGLDNPTIARSLFLSEKTVRNYVSGIFGKLHVDSRAEAIVLGREAGLGRAG